MIHGSSIRPKKPRIGPLGTDAKLHPLPTTGAVSNVGGLLPIGIHPAINIAALEMNAQKFAGPRGLLLALRRV